MQRRKFLAATIAAGSAFTVGGTSAIAGVSGTKQSKKTKVRCKITVLKKEYSKELYQKYTGKDGKPCPLLDLGQEFVTKNKWDCPEGFCNWAWADIRPFIQQIYGGQSQRVVCCTDGYRPVIFHLERIEVVVEE